MSVALRGTKELIFSECGNAAALYQVADIGIEKRGAGIEIHGRQKKKDRRLRTKTGCRVRAQASGACAVRDSLHEL